ncbi:AMP-binding protein [Streptomyces albus]|uniref:AMP-binding protein n=1 Tax=Streptomyces albus TaxID=1888 RepID=UPI0033D8E83B
MRRGDGADGAAVPGTIHEAVSRWARRTPAAVAVRQGDRRLTYAGLEAAANGYAAELAGLGAAPGARVPVLLPRSPELAAVLLGVLKTGAAYSALDPRWPAERIDTVCASLGFPHPVRRVRPVEDAMAQAHGRYGVEVPCDGRAPAAVFFTSGTTGAPKGVVSPHEATTRLFGPGAFARFGAGYVTSSAAALPWDAFTLELWGPLVSGGTVVLAEDPYLLPASLARMIRRQGVDTSWLTASLFNLFVDEDVHCFRGLRQLLIGGERLSTAHVRRFLAAHPRITLINGYGPVESCVFATTHRITPEDVGRPDGIPLGRPVPRTEVLIRPDGPDDATGEICVSGAGLALGYLDDPEETAARFTTVTSGGRTSRVYRTGDTGFLDADGVLHYRGRRDRQVKIRGHRVEPQEIESAGASLDGVEQAVVVPVPAGGGFARLALFYTAPAPGPGSRLLGPEDVVAHLRSTLPPHCVPDHVERVDSLPLTSHGKTDRQALLGRVLQAHGPAAHGVVEELFAQAVRRFTSSAGTAGTVNDGMVNDIDWPADTPLLELGGTSLDAMRLCARLGAEFGVHLSVAHFLRNPTLNGLLELLSHAGAQAGSPTHPASAPVQGPGSGDGSGFVQSPFDRPAMPVPLTGMQAHFCLAHELRPGDPAALCRRVWRLAGPVDAPALEAALNDLHTRHEGLRAAYRLAADGPVATVDEGPKTVPLCVLAPGSGEDDLAEHLARPLRIERGEVWRCALVRLDEQHTLFGLCVHHVAFDGWSEAVLVAELNTAYAARLAGRAPLFEQPAPTPAQLADEYATARSRTDLADQVDHWRRTLSGVRDLEFPAPETAPGQSMGAVTFTVDAATARRLTQTARSCGGSLFLALLTGYYAALQRVLGQDGFCVGAATARRFGPLAVNAVSCLVDVVCVRLPVTAEMSASRPLVDLMDSSRAAVDAAMAHQEVPFQEVVAAINPQRGGRNPVYQTLFAFQNNRTPPLVLDGRAAEALRLRPVAAMAELVCEVWPEADGRLRVEVSYQSHAVRDETARRIAAAYQSLLRGAGRP